ncbi:hypothetical protein R1flu_013072 [Riccia fluitans]|uniref:Uncharacterized protein n=1 Tax=Riccia fluitans TaxID=41844 RepID=A0ABD1ZDG8_9MARC
MSPSQVGEVNTDPGFESVRGKPCKSEAKFCEKTDLSRQMQRKGSRINSQITALQHGRNVLIAGFQQTV